MQKIISLASCIALSASLCAAADSFETDSPDSLIHYTDLNYLYNVEHSSLNPVGLSNVVTDEVARLNIGYNWGMGQLHNVDASGHTDAFNVGVGGIKRLKKVVVEGTVEYFNENKRNSMWNSTLFQSPLNPFILADSISSNYNTERFRVAGRVAYSMTDRLTIGIGGDYNVGVMSDEQDPRLETKGMRFILNPGIQWKATSSLALGATVGINLFNESTRYTCLGTAVNYKYFIMNGLGSFYPQTGNSYSRDAKGASWFAGIDLRYRFSQAVSDYFSATYERQNENANDGGSTYQFKAGKYTDNAIHLYNRTSILLSNTAHNVELRYDANRIDGRWYEQRPVIVNTTVQYEVMNSAIKHKAVALNLSGSYRFDLLNAQGIPSLTAHVGLLYTHSEAKNYPELYRRKYDRLTTSLAAIKYFSVKKVRLGVGVDGSYGTGLSDSWNFDGEDLADIYSIPMTAYLTSDIYSIGGRVTADLPLRHFIIGLSAGAHTNQCTGSLRDIYRHKGLTTLDCSLSLYF